MLLSANMRLRRLGRRNSGVPRSGLVVDVGYGSCWTLRARAPMPMEAGSGDPWLTGRTSGRDPVVRELAYCGPVRIVVCRAECASLGLVRLERHRASHHGPGC